MDTNIEKDCTALGGLFQSVISDMRASTPIWEDFTSKSTKLQSSLKSTIVAIGVFLDAFQKIADMATNSRGATKEIGLALTRLCIRHRSIESKLKSLSGLIQDTLVVPLQEKVEEWKKTVVALDKDHAKEYKKAKQEIKRAASDTIRLQKKAKKGKSGVQYRLDSALQDVNDKYILLEETEKSSLRTALIEERSRFCFFISSFGPFVDGEMSLLTEVTHLQEIMEFLNYQTQEPHKLPSASEQIILDMKGQDKTVWNYKTPPSSPSSLGSRKSSMCSISSITSSSSGSTNSHSPSHQLKQRCASQLPQPSAIGVARLMSVSSQDSGFISQDTLFVRPSTPQSLNLLHKNSVQHEKGTGEPDSTDTESSPSTPSESYPNTPSANSTWTNWPNPPKMTISDMGRPHTISSAYEKHTRPALTAQLFEPPPTEMLEKVTEKTEMRQKPQESESQYSNSNSSIYGRPSSACINKMQPVLPPVGPKPKPKPVRPPTVPNIDPTYMNQEELANSMEQRRLDSQNSNEGDITPTKENISRGQAQMQHNSLELAQAIKELEESTAALNCAYENSNDANTLSMQCAYGNGSASRGSSSSPEDSLPVGGVPTTGNNIVRRCSLNMPKPLPPVRRTASISTTSPTALLDLRKSPPKQVIPPVTLPKPVAYHSQSSLEQQNTRQQEEGAYAELQVVQQNILSRKKQQKQFSEENAYACTSVHSYSSSQPASHSEYATPAVITKNVDSYVKTGLPSVIHSLNEKFSETQQTHGMLPVTKEEDEFPLPPTDEELREIERVYSQSPVNPQTIDKLSMHSVQQDIVMEIKRGPQLRKLSNKESDG